MRRGTFGLIDGDDHRQDTNGEPGNGTSGNEHASVDGSSLDDTSDNTNGGTELDGSLTSDPIGSLASSQGAD
jgi:hypothetical protein